MEAQTFPNKMDIHNSDWRFCVLSRTQLAYRIQMLGIWGSVTERQLAMSESETFGSMKVVSLWEGMLSFWDLNL